MALDKISYLNSIYLCSFLIRFVLWDLNQEDYNFLESIGYLMIYSSNNLSWICSLGRIILCSMSK